MNAMQWNPRYLAYAAAHGAQGPDEMLSRDRTRWPGGVMTGFIVWTSEQWSRWHKETGLPLDAIKGEHEHRAFDAWLADRAALVKAESNRPEVPESSRGGAR